MINRETLWGREKENEEWEELLADIDVDTSPVKKRGKKQKGRFDPKIGRIQWKAGQKWSDDGPGDDEANKVGARR